MIFNDGSFYYGMFKNNLMHGKGKFYTAHGETKGDELWCTGHRIS